MQREPFEQLILKMDRWAERSPGLYRWVVGAFALLGYTCYALLFAVALGLVGAIAAWVILKPSAASIKVALKLGLPLLVLVWLMVKSLRITWPEPAGVTLNESAAPELFGVIDQVRSALGVGKLKQVTLTNDYNASVSQAPRFGLFGSDNRLALGLPLMQALSVEDFTAVLAHEFGHLRHNHGRFSAWMYRSVNMFVNLYESTSNGAFLSRLLDWFVPRLDALSFPLRRRDEYQADLAAAGVVGRERMASALVNCELRAVTYDDFWTTINRSVPSNPQPPADVFSRWQRQLRAANESAPVPPSAAADLAKALARETDTTDTHPSLQDRLKNLGTHPRYESAPAQSAAEALLGKHATALLAQANNAWCAAAAQEWAAHHQKLQAARGELLRLEALAQERPLTPDEAFKRADLFEDLNPDADALPLFEAVLTQAPDHEGAQYATGRLLLVRGDARGVALMEPFRQADNGYSRMHANALLLTYYEKAGDTQKAKSFLNAAEQAHAEQIAREADFETLDAKDTFAPHGLGESAIGKLRDDLALFQQLSRAFLARKMVGDQPAFFLLAVELKVQHRLLDPDGLEQRIVETAALPGRSVCLRLDKNPAFKKRLQAVAGADVYQA